MIESQGYLPFLHLELQTALSGLDELLVILEFNKSRKFRLWGLILQITTIITSLPLSSNIFYFSLFLFFLREYVLLTFHNNRKNFFFFHVMLTRDLEQDQHNVICDLCGRWTYRGVSYHCTVCADWDYCALCYCLGRHSRNHVQLKMQRNDKYSHLLPVAQPICDILATIEHDEGTSCHLCLNCLSSSS